MRVCFVTPEYPPAIGGMGQGARRVAHGLCRYTDHDIHVLWIDLWKKQDTHLRADDVVLGTIESQARAPTLHYVDPTQWEFANPNRAYYVRLGELARNIPFEVIVAHGASYCGFPVILRAKELGICTVVATHGGDINHDVFRPALFGHIHWVLSSADAVVSVSGPEYRIANAVADLGARGTVIPNHINPEDFATGVAAPIPLHSSSIVIVMAAGFTRDKGLHILLEAASNITDVPLTLLLIGDAQRDAKEYFRNHVNRYRDRLTIVETGVVPHRDILSYLRAADIFVLPSLSEGAPNILLEAMLAGVAIIASDVGAVRDTIQHDVNGLIVQPGSVDELAAAISRLAGDEALRRRLAAAANDEALISFSPAREAFAWDVLLRSLS